MHIQSTYFHISRSLSFHRKGKYFSLSVGKGNDTESSMAADLLFTHNINYIGFGQYGRFSYQYQIINKQGIPVATGVTKERYEYAGFIYHQNINYFPVFNGKILYFL